MTKSVSTDDRAKASENLLALAGGEQVPTWPTLAEAVMGTRQCVRRDVVGRLADLAAVTVTEEDHERQQQIIRDLQHERDEALKASATSRLVAKELRTLAGAWDVYGIGGPLMALADKLEAHKVAEAPSVLAVVEEMERHISGVEGAEDSPVATWARELREVVGWPVRGEEDARAAKWVREHGGLYFVSTSFDWHSLTTKRLYRMAFPGEDDCEFVAVDDCFAELDRRLMPPGMEWPRFDDGEKVCIANRFASQEDGEALFLRAIFVDNAGVDLISDECSEHLGFGERVKRPAVLAADGEPLEVGQTVCGIGRSQHEFEVLALNDVDPKVGDRFNVKCFDKDENEECWCDPNMLTHQRPVLDADGVPIKKGDTVWLTGESEHSWTVTDVSERHVGGYCREDGSDLDMHSKSLTHTKPEPPDSWDALWDDIEDCTVGYESFMRRCRALAGVSD